MLLNLDFGILDLDGQVFLKSPSAAKLLAQRLSMKAPGISPIKAYDWALKLFDGGTIEIDNADQEALKRIIENDESLTVISKAQLLNAFKQES